eukprot:scaffold1919_cov69-Cylindrotheca_fusiformis.AAC.3
MRRRLKTKAFGSTVVAKKKKVPPTMRRGCQDFAENVKRVIPHVLHSKKIIGQNLEEVILSFPLFVGFK